MGIFLGLVSFIGWGLGDIFGVVASRKVGSFLTTTYQFLIGIILSLFILPFFWQDFFKITTGLLLLNIIFGTFYVLANFLVNEGFKQSNSSIVGIIIQSFPALVLILSALIFKDSLSFLQTIWILLVFVGVCLCSANFADLKIHGLKIDRGIKFALIASLIFSVYFTFFRFFSGQYGWFLPNFISFLTLPLAMHLAKKIIGTKESVTLPKKSPVLAILASTILIRSGDVALNLGTSLRLTSTVTPIAGAAPVLFVLTSALVFKDKISKQQITGIILALAGIVGLSYFI